MLSLRKYDSPLFVSEQHVGRCQPLSLRRAERTAVSFPDSLLRSTSNDEAFHRGTVDRGTVLCAGTVHAAKKPAHPVKHDVHKAKHDHQALKHDYAQQHQAQQKLQADRKKMEADIAAGNTDQLTKDSQQFRQDRQQYRQDRSQTAADQQQWATDRHDLRRDERQLGHALADNGKGRKTAQQTAGKTSGSSSSPATINSPQIQQVLGNVTKDRQALGQDRQNVQQARQKLQSDWQQIQADVASGNKRSCKRTCSNFGRTGNSTARTSRKPSPTASSCPRIATNCGMTSSKRSNKTAPTTATPQTPRGSDRSRQPVRFRRVLLFATAGSGLRSLGISLGGRLPGRQHHGRPLQSVPQAVHWRSGAGNRLCCGPRVCPKLLRYPRTASPNEIRAVRALGPFAGQEEASRSRPRGIA